MNKNRKWIIELAGFIIGWGITIILIYKWILK